MARPHGRAQTSARWPRAHATCDRCGFRFNHDQLAWQFQWAGPKLQNLRILVCKTCMDVPQEQLRTIILPPDPVPIQNPRPEQYAPDNNPQSPIGQGAIAGMAGTNIGTLVGGAGTYACFDGQVRKRYAASAYLTTSGSSFANWVGKNWQPVLSPAVTGMSTTPQKYTATSFTAYAPSDARFLASGATVYAFQASSDGATWTTLATGNTAGTIGETLAVTTLSNSNASQYHRFVLSGDGVTAVAVAQLSINTDRGTSIL